MRRSVLAAAWCVLAAAFPARAAQGPDLKPVVVRPGDTLWSIAQSYLRDPRRWNVLLRHNKLPTNDPTVALPGMTLRVPVSELKDDAASLVELMRKVLARRHDSPEWDPARKEQVLLDGDGLRTMERSWARVRFLSGHELSVDPVSMAILKAPKAADHDLFLKRGGIHATVARVRTPSALIVPKSAETKYSARVLEDLSTRVQVYKGEADVKGAERVVRVSAGFMTDVPAAGDPGRPAPLPKLDLSLDADIAAAGGDTGSVVRVRQGAPAPGDGELAAQIEDLSVGIPVAGYHIQIARDRGFSRVAFDRVYDAYDPLDLRQASLPDGQYWVRVAVIDLLGERGRFSAPRPYRVGAAPVLPVSGAMDGALELIRPGEEETFVRFSRYRVMGRADEGLAASVNGRPVDKDKDGYFSLELELRRGDNRIRVSARDQRGNQRSVERVIRYDP